MIEIMLPTVLSEMARAHLGMMRMPDREKRISIRLEYLRELLDGLAVVEFDYAQTRTYFLQFDSEEQLVQFKLTYPTADIHVVWAPSRVA